ncbi:hypothetical protein CEXT_550801 [Caerostris extrusa]|uniref:Uncharacterized protein n=1 Tax=Caerostris extrusa TaxID=172846 RepID=A0AAV4TUS3_CAEEX|nr:hypothetical protein CEXT_550801 [Caerostris extrusa]
MGHVYLSKSNLYGQNRSRQEKKKKKIKTNNPKVYLREGACNPNHFCRFLDPNYEILSRGFTICYHCFIHPSIHPYPSRGGRI